MSDVFIQTSNSFDSYRLTLPKKNQIDIQNEEMNETKTFPSSSTFLGNQRKRCKYDFFKVITFSTKEFLWIIFLLLHLYLL